MKRAIASSLLLLGLGITVSGCIVAPPPGPHPGFCYYHPVYCARH